MPLQFDSTVHYIKRLRGNIFLSTQSTLISSPYNTRKYLGLPPGPICNPSEESIRAAANPIPSKYLYYVSKNDGTDLHYFSTNEAGHIANIKRAAANGGG